MGEEFSWLIEAISTLAKAEGWPEQVIKKMDVLGKRLSFGSDLKGLELAKLRIRGLGRGFISRLVQNSYDSPKALSDLSIQDLQKIVPEDLARRIVQKVGRQVSELLHRPQNNSPSMQEKNPTVCEQRDSPGGSKSSGDSRISWEDREAYVKAVLAACNSGRESWKMRSLQRDLRKDLGW